MPPPGLLPAVEIRLPSKVVLCTHTRAGSPVASAATNKPPPAVLAWFSRNDESKMLSLALERATAPPLSPAEFPRKNEWVGHDGGIAVGIERATEPGCAI